MELKSPAFGQNEPIPAKYTCDGKNVSPPLEFFNVPGDADSLTLIVTDADAPTGTFYHWVLWNINPSFDGIGEGNIVEGSVEGINSGGKLGYTGPCPPAGKHRYVFKLYALTGNLLLSKDTLAYKVEEELRGKVVAEATLVGTYERQQNE